MSDKNFLVQLLSSNQYFSTPSLETTSQKFCFRLEKGRQSIHFSGHLNLVSCQTGKVVSCMCKLRWPCKSKTVLKFFQLRTIE